MATRNAWMAINDVWMAIMISKKSYGVEFQCNC